MLRAGGHHSESDVYFGCGFTLRVVLARVILQRQKWQVDRAIVHSVIVVLCRLYDPPQTQEVGVSCRWSSLGE